MRGAPAAHCHHEVAVGATLTVWAFRICGVTVKLPVAISKLLLGQPGHPFRALNWHQLLHVGQPVFAGVHRPQPLQQLLSPAVMILVHPLSHLSSQYKIQQLTVGFVSNQLVPVAQRALQPLYLHWVPSHRQEH
jgi:hypothetical protein